MPTTAHYGIPTPDYKDPADGPAAFKAVADALDGTLFTEAQRMQAAAETVAASPRTAGRTAAFLLMAGS